MFGDCYYYAAMGPRSQQRAKQRKGAKIIFLMLYLRHHVVPEGDRPAIGVDAEPTATNY
jgi:hypothetical protein